MALITERDALAVLSGPKPRKADDAYAVLKDLIITMQIQPGDPLDERALMNLLDLGRTPVREAIQRLTHDQLVVSLPRRGYYVSQLSITEFQQMTTAREVIEPQVVRMATQFISAAEIAQLREIIDTALPVFEELTPSDVLERDLRFHSIVAEASRNRYLAAMAIELNTLMLRYWYISFTRVPHLAEDWAKHHSLIDFLEARDEQAASIEMMAHIARFRQRMIDVIASSGSLAIP